MSAPGVDPLLDELAAGREAAFAALYDRWGAQLFRAAVGITGSREDAEDAVQDVFAGLARARGSLNAVDNLPGYLFAALRRAAIRHAEARRAESRAVEQLPPHAPAAPIEQNARLERALAALPTEQREVLALKIDAELTFEEVAAALSVSPNTAASRYRYAIEKLRASMLLEGEAPAEPKSPSPAGRGPG
jgi:RNA polymerase sigma-70 factor (ECF subfamily)